MEDLVGDALAVLDAAGHESAHVFGVSMGGMVAQHLALDHPDRVKSLILGCTHPGGQPGGPPWRMLASIALRPLLGPSRTFPIVAPLLYSERTRKGNPDRLEEDIRLRWQERTPVATAPAQAAAVIRHDTRGRLGELRMPTLIIHGDEDTLIPPSAAWELAERIPNSHLVMVPGAGHVIATDAEQECADAVLGFLAGSG
jgi:pimeloyl-ACP methyl ester carboxylesterase